jgi:diacylglycerol kinase (ATP)
VNIALVVNTKAGGGKAKNLGASIARELSKSGHHFTEIREKNVAATIQTFSSIHQKDPFTTIISVGGDGLAHLLFPLAIKHSIPIFVAPAGTGNDFARSTGSFGLGAREIVHHISNTNPQYIDMGEIEQNGEKYFFGQVLSTGFDSLVNERANRYRFLRGKIKYIVAVARELPFFVPRNYRFILDGIQHETGAMLVAIANGRSYGGGMKVCPNADMQDGQFDVLILKPVPLGVFIRVFPKVFSGKHISHPAVEIRRGSIITLESNAIAYADGERIGSLPVKVKVLPKALMTWLM